MNVQFSVNDRDLLKWIIMDMEGQPSKTTVNEGVTDVDIPAALAAEAPSSAATTTPPVSQDAPVNPAIQPQNHQNQVASQQTQQPCDGHQQQQLEAFWSGQLTEINQITDFKPTAFPWRGSGRS
jgi:nuclear transcription factor Y gamma